jgi:hypothetical protein
MKKTLAFVVALVSALSIGCGPENMTSTTSSSSSGGSSGLGSLTIKVSGRNAAKMGFPSDDDGTMVSFVDGWSVQFSKFIVSFGAIDVHGTDGAMGVTTTDRYVADLHEADAALPTFDGLASRHWEHFGFEISPPDATSKVIGNVEDPVVQTMIAGKYNYLLQGTATKGAEVISFSYGIASATKNTDCKYEGASGILIQSDMTAEAEITIHAAHVFFDALESESAALRFDAMGAVCGTDKKLDIGEVASQALSALKDATGMPLKDASGNPVVYNTGSVQLPTPDLLAFMQYSSSRMAHLNGNGTCTVTGL